MEGYSQLRANVRGPDTVERVGELHASTEKKGKRTKRESRGVTAAKAKQLDFVCFPSLAGGGGAVP